MNITAKLKSSNVLKSRLGILLVFCFIIVNTQAQDTVTSMVNIGSKADLDWKTLTETVGNFGFGYREAVDVGVLEMWKYEDKIFKKASLLAKAFFYNYPEDPRHQKALLKFFSPYAKPHFMPEKIPDSLIRLIASYERSDKRKNRLKPVDVEAWKQWLQIGNDMVKSVVNSNVSLELKEAAEFQLICREVYHAIEVDHAIEKDKLELEYWNRFEIRYWQHIKLLLEKHVNKYASLEIVAHRVKNILEVINANSSPAAEAYWKYFYEIIGNDDPLSEQLGIKALHKLAKENVKVIEELKGVDLTKPLKMTFNSMDGRKVNLSNLRGKVVLIDFWATYCGPCIKEMPHVRAMYDKYRDKGFEVIGIAADGDKNRERIEAILKKTGANWPQRIDSGSDALVSYHALYKVKSLPTVWLLNKEGTIVDRKARGERLEPLIRKYLGLKK